MNRSGMMCIPCKMKLLEGHIDVAKMLIQHGADVNAVDEDKETALHCCARGGYVDVARLLIQNGVDINAVENSNEETALCFAASRKHVPCVLHLLCCGAEIDEKAIEKDETELLHSIEDRVSLLRSGNRIGTNLMSKEERRFLWNLAFFFTIKHGGACAFKTYGTIRSFITFHGIFMAPGFDLGVESVWRA